MLFKTALSLIFWYMLCMFEICSSHVLLLFSHVFVCINISHYNIFMEVFLFC